MFMFLSDERVVYRNYRPDFFPYIVIFKADPMDLLFYEQEFSNDYCKYLIYRINLIQAPTLKTLTNLTTATKRGYILKNAEAKIKYSVFQCLSQHLGCRSTSISLFAFHNPNRYRRVKKYSRNIGVCKSTKNLLYQHINYRNPNI